MFVQVGFPPIVLPVLLGEGGDGRVEGDRKVEVEQRSRIKSWKKVFELHAKGLSLVKRD